MAGIFSYIRFFLGIPIALEVIRVSIVNIVSWTLLLTALVSVIMYIWFAIVQDQTGIRSYIRFFISLGISINVVILALTGFGTSLALLLMSGAYIVLSLQYFLKKFNVI